MIAIGIGDGNEDRCDFLTALLVGTNSITTKLWVRKVLFGLKDL